jgi:LacI family transcriptional regulator
VDHVRIDLTRPVEEALQIMVDAGRRRIAYLVTSEAMENPREARTRAYLDFMEKVGRQPEIINIRANPFSARDLFREHIQAHGCPDGLLCQNDDTAISAYRAVLDTGRRVPEDILMVGCDGLRHMAMFEVPLSTIEQPLEECCVLAWQFLQARMAEPDRPIQQTTREGFLIRRESLG